MIYALILITAAGVPQPPVGFYPSKAECQETAKELVTKEYRAVCVRQQSQEESMAQAQNMMRSFMQLIPAQK